MRETRHAEHDTLSMRIAIGSTISALSDCKFESLKFFIEKKSSNSHQIIVNIPIESSHDDAMPEIDLLEKFQLIKKLQVTQILN